MGEFNVNKSDGSLEQTAGMPSEYPATQVMMSDGTTSVEDALDAVMPRTASGTTAAQLVSAINLLSEEQKDRCCIKITSSVGRHTLRRITGNYYTGIIATTNGATKYCYQFVAVTPPIYGYIELGAASFNDLSITEWTLYYQGAEIS